MTPNKNSRFPSINQCPRRKVAQSIDPIYLIGVATTGPRVSLCNSYQGNLSPIWCGPQSCAVRQRRKSDSQNGLCRQILSLVGSCFAHVRTQVCEHASGPPMSRPPGSVWWAYASRVVLYGQFYLNLISKIKINKR